MFKKLAITSCIALQFGCSSPQEPLPPEPSEFRVGAPFDPVEMVALVDADVVTVAAHDREAWLELFSSHAWIEEPKGTHPYYNNGIDSETGLVDDQGLRIFWDSFIVKTTSVFHVEQDIITDDAVLRNANLETHYANGLVITIPNHILYHFTEEDGELKIDRVEGYYEVAAVQELAKAEGPLGDQALLDLGLNIIKVQGLDGLLNYTAGTTEGIFDDGKQAVDDFANAINTNDADALLSLFADELVEIDYPVSGNTFSAAEFVTDIANINLTIQQYQSAGYGTSFEFSLIDNGVEHIGVGIFSFDPSSKKITAAKFYWNP